jgi:hypothetical protein
VAGPYKLKMTVYIESRCVFSRKFINQQLLPIYDDFKGQIHLEFVTFALAEVRKIFDVMIKNDKNFNF